MNINDKVICLSDLSSMDERWKVFHPVLPEKGKIYVIREVRGFGVKNCPIKGLLLVGVNSLNNTDGKEQAFSSFDFKLLKDRKEKKNMFGGEYDWLNKENE